MSYHFSQSSHFQMTPELDLLVKAAVQVPPKRHHTYIETYTHINKNRCMLNLCLYFSSWGEKTIRKPHSCPSHPAVVRGLCRLLVPGSDNGFCWKKKPAPRGGHRRRKCHVGPITVQTRQKIKLSNWFPQSETEWNSLCKNTVPLL